MRSDSPAELFSASATRILFDYQSLGQEEFLALCAALPRKVVRWLAIHHPDNATRLTLFRATGVPIGEGTVINGGVTIYDEYRGLVRIGARAAIAAGVSLVASSYPNNSRIGQPGDPRRRLIREAAVTIDDDAWIGAAAVILPGVTVGKMAVVGAGAIVTSSVPPGAVVAGNPARELQRSLAELGDFTDEAEFET